MQAELKQKWIDALRGGAYQQGKYKLRPRSDAYCCIGVLCNVLAPNDWQHPSLNNAFRHALTFEHPKSNGFTATGLTDAQADSLVSMNDREGRSFMEIADWIEANVPAE